jgi:hypothetical protein
MGGVLTIHSSGTGELLSGHSWIEYKPDGGTAKTYGTWGNNPGGLGNGLHENLELGRVSDASRSMRLTDAQEKAMYDKIAEYKARGDGGWGYLSPCSSFAQDVWQTATGESLTHRSGVISNPSKLKKSIEKANGKGPAAPPPPKKPSSSSASLKRPVQSCAA